MSLYHLTVPQFEKNLRNLERWIDKAVDHAKSKNYDPNTLLTARLAPDMLPLARQIQMVCDNAKIATSRLTGKEAPAHPDTEKTFDELRARVRSVLEYIHGYKPADFDGADLRLITLPWMPGKALTGQDYVADFALANFFFHYTVAYAILRHNGVELGKPDFIGSLPFKDS